MQWQKMNKHFLLNLTLTHINWTADLNISVNAMSMGLHSVQMDLICTIPFQYNLQKLSWKFLVCFQFPLIMRLTWLNCILPIPIAHEIKTCIKKKICKSRKKIVVENPQVCTQQNQTTIFVRVLTSQTGAIYCSNWSDMKEIEIHDKGRQTTMHLNTFFFSFFHPNINSGYFLSIPCHSLCRHQFNFYIHNCLALR